MAIDTTLFAAELPAAAYAVGDRIPMTAIRGPKIVRDGYGAAILKKITTLTDLSATSGSFAIHVKNSNWVDEMSNPAISATDPATLGEQSSAIQSGQDLPLVRNSGWEVYAECIIAVTTTSASDLFALIDVDYPSVAAVENPKKVSGFPVTIEDTTISHTITAAGSALSAQWTSKSVDIFKAGSKYLLTEAAFRDGSNCGFLSVSGAAGQAGLERIIPVKTNNMYGLRYSVDYSTPLVKGPMNLNLLSFGTAGTVTPYLYMDYVKKNL